MPGAVDVQNEMVPSNVWVAVVLSSICARTYVPEAAIKGIDK